jgi:arabinan endo-1,5-alpha-L-arabinosidase
MVLVRPGGGYALFSTGPGIRYRTSPDSRAWFSDPLNDRAFRSGQEPGWWQQYTNGGNPWGPDVSYHGGQYWMYYAVSHFPVEGEEPPYQAIGLATSADGTPGSWRDHGSPLIVSQATPQNPMKAIGPNLLVTSSGQWHLYFGSGGYIYRVSLASGTGLPTSGAQRVAHHTGLMEAPFVYEHAGYFYLFTSWGTCCSTDATYNIRVGRSSSPSGPFIDRSGQWLHYVDASGVVHDDGGTLVLEGTNRTIPKFSAAGSSGVYRGTDGKDHLYYHYYSDPPRNPVEYLGIDDLKWTANDWPYVIHDYGTTLPTPYRIFSEDYLQSTHGEFRLIVQQDCNLVERRLTDSTVVWSSHTFGYGPNCRLVMQPNGVLALFDSAGVQRWRAETNNVTANQNRLELQDDGNFVVYTRDNQVVCSRRSLVKPCDPPS